MRTTRAIYVLAYVVAGLLLLAPDARAQASITGVVRDSSGAVLPGVTVEASSAALIEKMRTAVTDGNGQYRIVDLRAGQYPVAFTLPGFTTEARRPHPRGCLHRNRQRRPAGRRAEETITVTGESPVVDVQSVRRQITIDNEMIGAIPGVALVQQPDAADAQHRHPGRRRRPTCRSSPGMVVFGGAGGRSNEGRLNVDGISVGSAFNGAGVSSYVADIGNAREVTMTRREASARTRAADRRSTSAEGRRQQHQRQLLRRWRRRADGRQQLQSRS